MAHRYRENHGGRGRADHAETAILNKNRLSAAKSTSTAPPRVTGKTASPDGNRHTQVSANECFASSINFASINTLMQELLGLCALLCAPMFSD